MSQWIAGGCTWHGSSQQPAGRERDSGRMQWNVYSCLRSLILAPLCPRFSRITLTQHNARWLAWLSPPRLQGRLVVHPRVNLRQKSRSVGMAGSSSIQRCSGQAATQKQVQHVVRTSSVKIGHCHSRGTPDTPAATTTSRTYLSLSVSCHAGYLGRCMSTRTLTLLLLLLPNPGGRCILSSAAFKACLV